MSLITIKNLQQSVEAAERLADRRRKRRDSAIRNSDFGPTEISEALMGKLSPGRISQIKKEGGDGQEF